MKEGWRTGTGAIPSPSLVLQVPQTFQHPVVGGTFQHPVAGGTFHLTHGMETLVGAVSQRVTLVTSAWDTLEMGKSSGTSAIACAQPLGVQWAREGVSRLAVPPGVLPVTLCHASERDGASWSPRTMPWDHRRQLGSCAGCTGIWIQSTQGLWDSGTPA